MIYAVTGSVGSGKTTVAKIFAKYGYKVINADKIGHDILKKESIKKQLKENIGATSRKSISKIVFNNKNKLKILDDITWLEIKKEIKKKLTKKCILDAAVLLEAGWEKEVDKVIVIKATKKQQADRLQKERGYSKELTDRILRKQLPLRERLKKADIIITNTKGKSFLEKQIKEIISKEKKKTTK